LGNPAQGIPNAAGPQQQNCPIYIPSVVGDRLWQGEILQNVIQLKPSLETIQNQQLEIEILQVVHDFAIVMSQDCDLLRDHNRRQANEIVALPNVMLCDLYEAEALRLKINEEDGLGKKEWKKLIAPNQSERFQYLQRMETGEDLQGVGMPAMAVDFRLYFTLPTDELYYRLTQATRRRARLNTPYVEHFMQRFFKFQARVALPVDHAIDPLPPE
jgi:hypothetical protein